MARLRLAIVGLGRLGRACAEAVQHDESLALAGIVRRAERCSEALPDGLQGVRVADHISGLEGVDAALLCLPAPLVPGMAHDLQQQGIPLVECASLHGEEFLAHKHEIDRHATRFRVPAIVGAGWDPGALSLFRNMFALLCPHGHTETVLRPGINLHHSSIAGAIPGVKGAMATELRSAEGVRQNYLYIELEEGADAVKVEKAIYDDPLFVGEEILVFPVESIAALEEEGHGVLMERRGSVGGAEHQLFLLEARFSEYALSAQVMLCAARALPQLGKRAYSLFDLPPSALWGELREMAEREWE
jgi:diaminopimelate dehydrogenase